MAPEHDGEKTLVTSHDRRGGGPSRPLQAGPDRVVAAIDTGVGVTQQIGGLIVPGVELPGAP